MLSERDITITKRVFAGETQISLAKEFGLSHSSISVIVNRFCRHNNRSLHTTLLNDHTNDVVPIKILKKHASEFQCDPHSFSIDGCTKIEAIPELTTRAINCLHGEGVYLVGQFSKIFQSLYDSQSRCNRIPDCGETTKRLIRAVIKKYEIKKRFKAKDYESQEPRLKRALLERRKSIERELLFHKFLRQCNND